jgi:SAM-dependent methyltransferase
MVATALGAQDRAAAEWQRHWTPIGARRLVELFFSLYRQAVFARLVRLFTSRHFAPSGVFVEAGAGTAETSGRVDKAGGGRRLVAVDIVEDVLRRCHRAMDERTRADIFRMPFRAGSLDGIWNVGVMEHFTQAEIDQVMREFRQSLRPGGALIMFWPGVDSGPQRLLRWVERLVHRLPGQRDFRFHPPEISQLHSQAEASHILTRNGFRVVHVDWGLRSMVGLKTLVGVRPA